MKKHIGFFCMGGAITGLVLFLFWRAGRFYPIPVYVKYSDFKLEGGRIVHDDWAAMGFRYHGAYSCVATFDPDYSGTNWVALSATAFESMK